MNRAPPGATAALEPRRRSLTDVLRLLRPRLANRRTGVLLTLVALLGAAGFAATERYRGVLRENASLQEDLNSCLAQQDLLYNLVNSGETDPIPSTGYRSLLAMAAFYEAFVKENEDKPLQAGRVAAAYDRLGRISCRFQEFPQAVHFYRRALEVSKQAQESSPPSTAPAIFAADTLTNTAVALLRMQRPEEAAVAAGEARELMRAMEEGRGLPSELHAILADCCWCLAIIASHRDDFPEAEHYARRCLDLLKSRQDGARENPRSTQLLSDASFVLIHLLDQQEKRDQAASVCRDLISMLENLVAHDPIDRRLQMYLASARATLEDVLECPPNSLASRPSAAESPSRFRRSRPARRALPPLISPEKIFDTVIHRSALTLPAGECVVLHYHPKNEYLSRAAVQGYLDWIEGHQASAAEQVQISHNADDPFWAGGAFEYELAGTFNCHSFTFGELLGLGRSDWVVGSPDVKTDGSNPVRVILESYFQRAEAYDVSTSETRDRSIDEFERNAELADDDIVCFARQADGSVVHSGRIRKMGGKNWIVSKLGQCRIFLASPERTGQCFAGQFDRIEVYQRRSETSRDAP